MQIAGPTRRFVRTRESLLIRKKDSPKRTTSLKCLQEVQTYKSSMKGTCRSILYGSRIYSYVVSQNNSSSSGSSRRSECKHIKDSGVERQRGLGACDTTKRLLAHHVLQEG
jgi:hypothetical protein